MSILILHSLPPKVAGMGRTLDEFDLNAAAANVAAVLPGAAVVGVYGEVRELLEALNRYEPDVVFNACEAPLGRTDREAHVASLLEWLGVRFTGSSSETLALCRRKDRVNAVLERWDVPVPRTGVYPCIVKPADEDGSAFIDDESICDDAEAAARAKARLCGAAVEQEFLPGREFAVSVWGAREPEYCSIGETTFLNGLRLITYAAKWSVESADFANSPLDYDTEIAPALRSDITKAACGAWRAVEARGYLRIDLRCDRAMKPHVLDVNPNPELGPGVGICRAVQEAGWTWQRWVEQQIAWA